IELPLEIGAVIDLSIRTPWDTLPRKGRVAWTQPADGDFLFGVEYVELARDADYVGLLNMDRVKVDATLALKLPAQLALRRQVLPFAQADGQVYVACLNPRDSTSLQAVEKALGRPVCAEPAEPESLARALDRVYGDGAAGTAPNRS